jgi:UDP-glucose 4-epimerase
MNKHHKNNKINQELKKFISQYITKYSDKTAQKSLQVMIDLYKKINQCDFTVNVCPRREGDLERSVLDNPSPFMQKLYTMEDLLKV